MNKYKTLLISWAKALLTPRPLLGIFYLPRYFRDYFRYKAAFDSEKVSLTETYPCLLDWTLTTPFDKHYFYQGAWMARLLTREQPKLHVDVGSSVMMISVLSAMTKTIFVDYRPLKTDLHGLASVGASITCLPFRSDSVTSLSCQHVIEHIGLGRYGDPLDPRGSFKAAEELERILKPGGKLYLSLPVGRERICFNAHRIYSPRSVVNFFSHMKLLEFSYVDDAGRFTNNGTMDDVEDNEYACGMFLLQKDTGTVTYD